MYVCVYMISIGDSTSALKLSTRPSSFKDDENDITGQQVRREHN